MHVGVPAGSKFVLHTCDNPWCVNPSHLFLGSDIDNIRDMISKDRHQRGERHAYSKLTDNVVRRLRKSYKKGIPGWTKQQAEKYGVHVNTILRAVNGRSWAHL